MLSEALVIFACVNSTGCSETSSHYYNTHPEIREIVKYNEKRIERFIEPTFIQVTGPIMFAAAGGTGTVRLNRYFSLQMNTKKGILMFNKDF